MDIDETASDAASQTTGGVTADMEAAAMAAPLPEDDDDAMDDATDTIGLVKEAAEAAEAEAGHSIELTDAFYQRMKFDKASEIMDVVAFGYEMHLYKAQITQAHLWRPKNNRSKSEVARVRSKMMRKACKAFIDTLKKRVKDIAEEAYAVHYAMFAVRAMRDMPNHPFARHHSYIFESMAILLAGMVTSVDDNEARIAKAFRGPVAHFMQQQMNPEGMLATPDPVIALNDDDDDGSGSEDEGDGRGDLGEAIRVGPDNATGKREPGQQLRLCMYPAYAWMQTPEEMAEMQKWTLPMCINAYKKACKLVTVAISVLGVFDEIRRIQGNGVPYYIRQAYGTMTTTFGLMMKNFYIMTTGDVDELRFRIDHACSAALCMTPASLTAPNLPATLGHLVDVGFASVPESVHEPSETTDGMQES
jgi:hypothetical protein